MGQIKNIKLHIVTDIKGNNSYNKMIIPKKNRVAIYESLFKDGVMVAIKDFNLAKHSELEKVRNLEVIKAMQSLKSRGYVRENFAWRHYYWYSTNEGIQYLRDFLHLPPEIVPATLRKATKPSEIVMVETEMRTDVKVVVVMHAWTREVLEITSKQNFVEEWVVLEEDVVDLQVVDLVLLHQPALEDLAPHQVKISVWCNWFCS